MSLRPPLIALALVAPLAGCAPQLKDIMRAPDLSPVGAGISDHAPDASIHLPPLANAVAPPVPVNLYVDQRVAHVGDILTVNISINDKAVVGNSSDRKTTSNGSFGFDWLFTPETSSSGATQPTPLTYKHDFNSTSSSQGNGDINRSEQIQLSVPAIVTQVLPNGNLVIKGSQEVRVNFELRELTIAGIVRPYDISRDNTVAYDRIAEARISYGGRGRISEVQQPGWGQQVYDIIKPY
jgi:flagellar L-ring protein precursor FlgH